MLGTKHKLNNKGLKKKHFTGVVKNIGFSHTVKNISFSCKILKFFIVQREKKSEIVEMYKMTTHLRIQCTLYIYQ